MNSVSEFAQDLYDVLGMNKDFCTQEQFYDRYVEYDNAFQIDTYVNKAEIWFDDYKITIKPR